VELQLTRLSDRWREAAYGRSRNEQIATDCGCTDGHIDLIGTPGALAERW